MNITNELEAQTVAPCPTCGESEPYTGSCGASDSDVHALCKRKPIGERAAMIDMLHTGLFMTQATYNKIADMLAADASDEWHRGRAAGIEECERLNAELQTQAQQVAVPQGWKLVPVAIPDEAIEVLVDRLDRVRKGACVLFADIWADLLAAAPPPPQADAQQVAVPQGWKLVAWMRTYTSYPDSPEDAAGFEVTSFHQNKNSPTLPDDIPLFTPQPPQADAPPQRHPMNVLERAKTMYAEHPTYQGTKPMPWGKVGNDIRREWLDKAVEAHNGIGEKP